MMIKMQSLRKQRGAATLLVGILTILIVTIGSFALTRQISADSGSNNSLYFRNKALEAANAGIASLIADISDQNSTKLYISNLDTYTSLSSITINSKYNFADTGFTLKIMKISDDPTTGMKRMHAQSTGCYPVDCTSGTAIIEQDILVGIYGGINKDWLSVNKSLNRQWDSVINVHNAPQGTTGTGVGAGINNCNGTYLNIDVEPSPHDTCQASNIVLKTPPEGGSKINSYEPLKFNTITVEPQVYYTNWAPIPGAPAGTNCTQAPDATGPNCGETMATPALPAVRPVLSSQKYFEKYYGNNTKSDIKNGIQNSIYHTPEYPASTYVWIDGNVTLKSDGKLYNSVGTVIPTTNKHLIIDGNLTSDGYVGLTADPSWIFMYVTKDVKLSMTGRFNGSLAVEGNFNIHGSLQFYVDPGAKGSFKPFESNTYGGKSGWRDF